MGDGGFGEQQSTLTAFRTVSEADIALFELIIRGERPAPDDVPATTNWQPRQAAPHALTVALLTAAAVRHLPEYPPVKIVQQEVRCYLPIYTDDTVQTDSSVLASEPGSSTVRVFARCFNQDGLELAEGQFDLSAG